MILGDLMKSVLTIIGVIISTILFIILLPFILIILFIKYLFNKIKLVS